MNESIEGMQESMDLLLAHMDSHFESAKKAMGIRPNLTAVAEHVKEANVALHELGHLILLMQHAGAGEQPQPVIDRINACASELVDLARELEMCTAVQTAGDKRNTPLCQFGAN